MLGIFKDKEGKSLYLINGSLFVMFGIIFHLVVRDIVIGIRYQRRKQVYLLKEFIGFLFVIYICMVVSVTLFPFPIGFNTNIENVYRSINIIPLKSIIDNISQIGIAYDGDVPFMIVCREWLKIASGKSETFSL